MQRSEPPRSAILQVGLKASTPLLTCESNHLSSLSTFRSSRSLLYCCSSRSIDGLWRLLSLAIHPSQAWRIFASSKWQEMVANWIARTDGCVGRKWKFWSSNASVVPGASYAHTYQFHVPMCVETQITYVQNWNCVIPSKISNMVKKIFIFSLKKHPSL